MTATINEAGPLHADATHDVAMILAYLGALPADPDAIAEHLRERGVRGVPCGSNDCALAVYLQSDVYGIVDVGTDDVTVHVREWSFTVKLPAPVRAFRVDFDCGAYPALFASGGES